MDTNFATHYFERYKTLPPFLYDKPDEGLGVVVIIPCIDDDFIFRTLDSLESANAILPKIEVIVHVNSGEGKASLLAAFPSFLTDNPGVDKHISIAVPIDDDELLGDADLRGGNPDTICRVHGFPHVVDQFSEFTVELRNGRRLPPKRFMRIDENFKHSHLQISPIHFNCCIYFVTMTI